VVNKIYIHRLLFTLYIHGIYTFFCTSPMYIRDCRGCDRMVIGLITTYAISAYLSPLKLWVWNLWILN